MNNYSDLQMAILDECLRYKSTSEVSKALGFNFDKAKRWLEGSKILKWNEFCQLCKVLNLDILAALKLPLVDPESSHYFDFLKKFLTFETNQDVADYLSCHVSVVKRYSHGDTFADLEKMLKLFDYRTNYLSGFLTRLFPNPKNHLIRKWINQGLGHSLNPAYLETLILSSVDLRGYAERTTSTAEWLSYQLNIDINIIRQKLDEMVRLGYLKIISSGDYKSSPEPIHLQNSFVDLIPYFQAFNQKLIEHLEEKKKESKPSMRPGMIAQRVFAVDQETLKKINIEIMKLDSEILKIVNECNEPKDIVCCSLLEVFPLTKISHN